MNETSSEVRQPRPIDNDKKCRIKYSVCESFSFAALVSLCVCENQRDECASALDWRRRQKRIIMYANRQTKCDIPFHVGVNSNNDDDVVNHSTEATTRGSGEESILRDGTPFTANYVYSFHRFASHRHRSSFVPITNLIISFCLESRIDFCLHRHIAHITQNGVANVFSFWVFDGRNSMIWVNKYEIKFSALPFADSKFETGSLFGVRKQWKPYIFRFSQENSPDADTIAKSC